MTGDAAGRSIGSFAVEAGRDEVEAFRRSTGGMGAVPLTFPLRWLMLPEVRESLLAVVAEPDVVPVHESQSFDYVAPLQAGASYRLDVSAHRASTPDRLVVEAVVVGAGEAVCARLETVLRLIPLRAAA